MRLGGTFPIESQKVGWSSVLFFSLLASSDRVVAELLLDRVEASEGLCLERASEGETNGLLRGSVSPWKGTSLDLTIPRRRVRPNEARREDGRILRLAGTERGLNDESTLSAVCGLAERRGARAAVTAGESEAEKTASGAEHAVA